MRGRSDAAAEHHGPQFAEPTDAKSDQAAPDGYTYWLALNPAPDLAELVKAAGGNYRQITAAQWEAFDRAYADWNWRRLNRL